MNRKKRRRPAAQRKEPTRATEATAGAESSPTFLRRILSRRAIGLLVLLAILLATWWWVFAGGKGAVAPVAIAVAPVADVSQEHVDALCSNCHQRPEPAILPKSNWTETIWMMSTFGGYGTNVREAVDTEAVVHWYRQRAPEQLDLPALAAQGPGGLKMKRHALFSAAAPAKPFVSHMRCAQLVGGPRPELIVCDMRNGQLLMAEGELLEPRLKPIGAVPFPAHVELTDLDADGRMDLIVANLGSFRAMDHKLGSIEWFRQTTAGAFERVTLADDLGRVADVEPADVDGDGDIDLVVAEFGWRGTGHLLLFDNRSSDPATPEFVSKAIDGFHGNSHVCVTDLDDDGALDILALYSQEHELVRAYLNRGKLRFELHDLFRAPHPAWGYSGFEVVDLDLDGDVDVLLTNGDTYDNSLLKPYHGIQWLENRGDLDFQIHDLARMYGVYRAEAADLDGDGDLDIVACALAELASFERESRDVQCESILWLEQVEDKQFIHRSFESSRGHHPTLTFGDYDQDGDVDLFVGNGQFDDTVAAPEQSCVDLWLNELK